MDPRIPPLDPADIEPLALSALGPLGRRRPLPNIFRTFAHHPPLLVSYVPFGLHLLRSSTLPARLREIAILRIAALHTCEYEFSQHHEMAIRAGVLSEQECVLLLDATSVPAPGTWSACEAAVLAAAAELTDTHTLAAPTWQLLETELSHQQLLDLIFTLGLYSMLAWALNAIAVNVDPGITSYPWPPPVTEARRDGGATTAAGAESER